MRRLPWVTFTIMAVCLLLDSPWGDREAVRSVRLMSNTFDPRSLVGGEDALQAFRAFLNRVLVVSEAVPLPDPDSARGKPFRTFTTVGAYQQQVLNIAPQ